MFSSEFCTIFKLHIFRCYYHDDDDYVLEIFKINRYHLRNEYEFSVSIHRENSRIKIALVLVCCMFY